MSDFKHNTEANYIEIIQRLVKTIVILALLIVALVILNLVDLSSPKKDRSVNMEAAEVKKDSASAKTDALKIKDSTNATNQKTK